MLVIIFIGNHTFAAIRGTESYSLLSSLTDVMSDINALIEKPVLDGKKLRVLCQCELMLVIIFFSMAVPSSVHGYECCTLNICLFMVYCVFRQKVY